MRHSYLNQWYREREKSMLESEIRYVSSESLLYIVYILQSAGPKFFMNKNLLRMNFSDQNQWEDSEKRQVTLTKW